MTRAQRAEQIAAKIAADPRTAEWNSDGGAGAIDFIRNFDARSSRTQAEKDADRRARCAAILAQMRAPSA